MFLFIFKLPIAKKKNVKIEHDFIQGYIQEEAIWNKGEYTSHGISHFFSLKLDEWKKELKELKVKACNIPVGIFFLFSRRRHRFLGVNFFWLLLAFKVEK